MRSVVTTTKIKKNCTIMTKKYPTSKSFAADKDQMQICAYVCIYVCKCSTIIMGRRKFYISRSILISSQFNIYISLYVCMSVCKCMVLN